jgi:hypothetical protein
MKGKPDKGKIIQKARLQNSADLAAVLAGKIKPGKVRTADVDLLVEFRGANRPDLIIPGPRAMLQPHGRWDLCTTRPMT